MPIIFLASKWAYLNHARKNYESSVKALNNSQALMAEQVRRQNESRRRFQEIQDELIQLKDKDFTMVRFIATTPPFPPPKKIFFFGSRGDVRLLTSRSTRW